MSTLKDHQEYIDRFRSGEISETDFTHRLESNADLKQEFERHQKDLQVIRSAAKEQLRKKALIALEKHKKKSATIFLLKRVMQIAAVFAFLAAAIFLIQKMNQPKSGSDLFANHFVLPDAAGERNANAQSDIWNEAMINYSNQDFKKTIELLAPLVDQPAFPFGDRGKLYLGLSQLMQNENQKAVNYFEAIDTESSFVQDAEWFRALAFLKMENLAEAKKAFQKIVNQPRHYKHAEALEILDNMQ
jgi:hypothetical protein